MKEKQTNKQTKNKTKQKSKKKKTNKQKLSPAGLEFMTFRRCSNRGA